MNDTQLMKMYRSSVGRVDSLKGFTLVELMIVVALVGILASVAIPSYRQYVIETGRSEPQAFLMDAHNRQQQFMLDNKVYADAIGELYGTNDASMETRSGSYVITVVTAADGFSYTLTATPPAGSSQEEDGPLSITSVGLKTPDDKW